VTTALEQQLVFGAATTASDAVATAFQHHAVTTASSQASESRWRPLLLKHPNRGDDRFFSIGNKQHTIIQRWQPHYIMLKQNFHDHTHCHLGL
jgi:hypothetical protein